MKQWWVGSQTRKKLFLLALIVALMSIPALVISQRHDATVIEELQNRAANIASIVNVLVSTDVEAYRQLSQVGNYQEGGYDVVYYQDMNALLNRILRETGADYIYTEKWVDNQTVAYLLDGADPESEGFSPIGSRDAMTDEERTAFLQAVPTVTGLIKDPLWGHYLSAFVPIIDDRDGSVIGLVGADFSADRVRATSRSMNITIVIGFLSLIMLTSITVLYVLDYIYRFSYTDYLTDSSSRRYFSKQLAVMVRAAQSKQQPFCLLMIDIDWFKHLNDTYGHSSGDRLLIEVSKKIREHIRSSDSCSRYGGDEFTVLLSDCRLKHAEIVARRILKGVSQLELPFEVDLPVSVSIGVVAWGPGMDERAMVDLADKALYQAKAQGKGRIVVHQEVLESTMAEQTLHPVAGPADGRPH